jgi:hypothetical protein
LDLAEVVGVTFGKAEVLPQLAGRVSKVERNPRKVSGGFPETKNKVGKHEISNFSTSWVFKRPIQ